MLGRLACSLPNLLQELVKMVLIPVLVFLSWSPIESKEPDKDRIYKGFRSWVILSRISYTSHFPLIRGEYASQSSYLDLA